jgi:ATP-dependent DNA ligase
VEYVGEQGERLFAAASVLEVEGIVAKRGDSPYRRRRSSDWLKIRTATGKRVQEERAKWME